MQVKHLLYVKDCTLMSPTKATDACKARSSDASKTRCKTRASNASYSLVLFTRLRLVLLALVTHPRLEGDECNESSCTDISATNARQGVNFEDYNQSCHTGRKKERRRDALMTTETCKHKSTETCKHRAERCIDPSDLS